MKRVKLISIEIMKRNNVVSHIVPKMTGGLIEDPDQFDLTVISHGSAHKGYSHAVDRIMACISPF